jgi:hypothetical protein
MGDSRLNLGCGKLACLRESRFGFNRADNGSMAPNIDRRLPFRLAASAKANPSPIRGTVRSRDARYGLTQRIAPPGLRNCMMLLKSLAVSVAAALLGPTLGIAMFFLADSNSARGQPLVTATRHEVVRSFAPSETWYDPSAQAVEVQALGLGSWQTVVRCPDGQALSEDGRCRSSDTQPPT